MSISPTMPAPWSFIQWVVTAIATILVSSIAFVWRLTMRIDRFEASLATQSRYWETNASASEAALLRLAERQAQAHDDNSRIREAVGSLPTRSDLRDLEDRVVEQLSALSARLDRSLEKREV